MLIMFLLGCLFVGIQLLIRGKLVKMGKAKLWPNCILVLLANASFVFSLAWAYESLIEYETQAAFMGLLIFGGTGIILAVIAYRLINKDEVKLKSKETKEA